MGTTPIPAGPATALSDRTPPTASTLTASTGTATGTVDLSWTAASDAGSGVAGYEVRYAQAQSCPAPSPAAYPSLIATGVATSLTVDGLSSRTRYCFYVAARDAAGNLGDASAPRSARAK